MKVSRFVDFAWVRMTVDIRGSRAASGAKDCSFRVADRFEARPCRRRAGPWCEG